MTINQKINAKGNRFLSPMRIIQNRYVGGTDAWCGDALIYKQDRKTNYKEPKALDGEDFCGNEAQNSECDYLGMLQRQMK